MTRFAIRKFVAFAVATALLACALHYAISIGLRRIDTGEIGSFNRAMQGKVDADIIISGSSRAFRHYDPRIMKELLGRSAFNLGRNASQIDVQYAVLKAYLKHNRAPTLIIQNLDIQSLVTTKPGAIYDPAEYVPYLGDPFLFEELQKIDQSVWRWRYLPLYAYATKDTLMTWTQGLRGLVGKATGEECHDGFSPMRREWTQEFAKFKLRNPKGIEVPIEPEAIDALRRIIHLCKDNGIPIILVYSPQYYEMIPLTRNRSRIFETFHSLCKEEQVSLLDYTDSALSQDQTLFYNSQHLNERGAIRFTRDLCLRLSHDKLLLH